MQEFSEAARIPTRMHVCVEHRFVRRFGSRPRGVVMHTALAMATVTWSAFLRVPHGGQGCLTHGGYRMQDAGHGEVGLSVSCCVCMRVGVRVVEGGYTLCVL
jgi:hypothetical protein